MLITNIPQKNKQKCDQPMNESTCGGNIDFCKQEANTSSFAVLLSSVQIASTYCFSRISILLH